MISIIMKKALRILTTIVALALMGGTVMAQTFDYPVRVKQGFSMTEKTRDGLHLSYEVGQVSLNTISYRSEEMCEVSINAIAIPNDAGKPNLPSDSRMMAIPNGATPHLRVVSVETETLHNVNIAPALRIQSENEEPDMNYVKDMNVYSKNALYPAEPFVMGNSYIRGDGHTITDDMTVYITERALIENALTDVHYCATDEPQPIAVTVTGDYNTFKWLTSGDGTFEDATAFETTYTPGLNDLNNGVSITAFVVTPGCGSITYEYPFEMHPMPEMTLEAEAIQLCDGENAYMNFSLDGVDGPGYVIINGAEYGIDENSTFIDLGHLPVGENVFNITEITSTCSSIFEEGEFTFTVNMNAAPTYAISEFPASFCEGESVDVEFSFVGIAPFTVETTGISGFTSDSDSYTLTFDSSVDFIVTKVTDATGCGAHTPAHSVAIEMLPVIDQPEISGDAEPDVRLTPTTTYTVTNDVMAGFSIEPEEAGTLLPANDGKSVVVTWSETYKGNAVLTATPTTECYTSEGKMNILVKNSTDVNEFGAKASLYPNPTNGNVTIEAEGLQRLTVMNEMGQVVYDAEVSSDTETLNMSQFGVGVYMIRIYTENGMGVKRVSVIR